MKPMKKVEKIVNSPKYIKYCNAIAGWEKDRVYCCHDVTHFTDTARVGYLFYLSKEVLCPELKGFSEDEIKEMIYAVGYLHDIGRFLEYEDPEKDHAVESAKLSRPFLKEAGFSRKEEELIVKAIENHRKESCQGFDRLIYLADKKSRSCYCCDALKTCKKFQNGSFPEIYI